MEIDHETFSKVLLFLPLIQEGLLSVTRESICTEYWLTAQSKLAQEKRVVRLFRVHTGKFEKIQGLFKDISRLIYSFQGLQV